MSTQSKDLGNLIKTLMDATCTYSAMKIHNEKNRFAYVRAVSRCYDMCMSRLVCDDIHNMKRELLLIKRDTLSKLKPRWFSRENQYYKLGVGQSLDVVESIITRFDKGYSHSDEFFVRSLLKSKFIRSDLES